MKVQTHPNKDKQCMLSILFPSGVSAVIASKKQWMHPKPGFVVLFNANDHTIRYYYLCCIKRQRDKGVKETSKSRLDTTFISSPPPPPLGGWRLCNLKS